MGLGGTNEPALAPTLFGHPAGLFTLFFAEMWERFNFYGMKALLLFYMTKAFLGYNDEKGYGVLGAYAALVYMTPFFGGILADRVLGQRRAVIIGGLVMALGQLFLQMPNAVAFYGSLALLIVGNGFFKPNISTIVGSLYPKDSAKKDAGFTIFYMGINLGAAIAPIICGYVGETYGWNRGFGLAAAGMLVGVAVFAAPTRVTQTLILLGALGTSVVMPRLQDSTMQLVVRIALAAALSAAGIIAVVALNRGGLPHNAGRPRDPDALRRKIRGLIRTDLAICLSVLLILPIVALLVQSDLVATGVLTLTSLIALAFVLHYAFRRCQRIERERLFVVVAMLVFCMVFFGFFEQSAFSVNQFTDRNVNRVSEERRIQKQEVGSTLEFRVPLKTNDAAIAKLPLLSQAQLGHERDGKLFTMSDLAPLREKAKKGELKPDELVVRWPVTEKTVGMVIASGEIPASEFQAVNPVYILLLGLMFSALWSYLDKRGIDPSTPVKFSMALALVALAFGILWYGTRAAENGVMSVSWLLLFYLVLTMGELCLSPVGLSMITRLSPTKIVSTMMGVWFLATAMSELLAGRIAKLTAVSSEDGSNYIPPPMETIHVYGKVFGQIAIASVIAGLVCLALSPWLKRWEHPGVVVEEPAPPLPAQPGGFPVQKAE